MIVKRKFTNQLSLVYERASFGSNISMYKEVQGFPHWVVSSRELYKEAIDFDQM